MNNSISIDLTEDQKTIQSNIQKLVEASNASDVTAIHSKIELGMELVNVAQAHPLDFNSIVPESLISNKTKTRRMKVVIKNDVDFTKAMKVTKDVKATHANKELLVLDTRVTTLTKEDIANIPDIYNGGLKKIESMKELSSKDWKKVVGGDDKPYQAMVEKKKDKAKAEKEAEKNKHKPAEMPQKEYDAIIKDGIYTAAVTIHDFSTKNEQLEKEIESLESEIAALKDKQHEMELKLARADGMLTVNGNFQNQDIDKQSKKAKSAA
jgi:hypothetical protein